MRVVALAVLVLGGSVGYGLWYHLLRAVPDPVYLDAAEPMVEYLNTL